MPSFQREQETAFLYEISWLLEQNTSPCWRQSLWDFENSDLRRFQNSELQWFIDDPELKSTSKLLQWTNWFFWPFPRSWVGFVVEFLLMFSKHGICIHHFSVLKSHLHTKHSGAYLIFFSFLALHKLTFTLQAAVANNKNHGLAMHSISLFRIVTMSPPVQRIYPNF
jgi:hypothetical protein